MMKCPLEALRHEIRGVDLGVDASDIDVFLAVPVLNRKILCVDVAHASSCSRCCYYFARSFVVAVYGGWLVV